MKPQAKKKEADRATILLAFGVGFSYQLGLDLVDGGEDGRGRRGQGQHQQPQQESFTHGAGHDATKSESS